MSMLFEFVEFEKIVIPEKKKYEIQAFAVYRAVEDFIKTNRDTLDIHDETYYYRRWNKLVENELKQKRLTWIVMNIKRIGMDLQNKIYDKKDLTLSLLFLYYFNKSMNLSMIKKDFVLQTVEKFSSARYEKDKQFVLEICKEVDIKGIEDFFRIDESGVSLVYKYIVDKEFISPLFYINLAGKVPAQNTQNKNNNYKKFEKISLAIKQLLTTN